MKNLNLSRTDQREFGRVKDTMIYDFDMCSNAKVMTACKPFSI